MTRRYLIVDLKARRIVCEPETNLPLVLDDFIEACAAAMAYHEKLGFESSVIVLEEGETIQDALALLDGR